MCNVIHVVKRKKQKEACIICRDVLFSNYYCGKIFLCVCVLTPDVAYHFGVVVVVCVCFVCGE